MGASRVVGVPDGRSFLVGGYATEHVRVEVDVGDAIQRQE